MVREFLLAVCFLVFAAGAHATEGAEGAEGGNNGPEGAAGDSEATAGRLSNVAAEFTDPLTTLPQVFLQNAYSPESYGTDGDFNRLTLRLIVPRVPESSLLPFVQLIRPSFSLVTVPTGKGDDVQTEFGDMALLDIGVLPWPDRKKTGLLMGLGPVFIFPTASDDIAGQGAWQVGPAFAAIYKGIPGLLLGGLVQNPISFAYRDRDRDSVNAMLVQPIVLAYVGKGFYVKSGDSTWTFDWQDDGTQVIPVSFGVGKVLLREGWPPLNFFLTGERTAFRENAKRYPKTTVRVGFTMAFPGWRPW